MGKDKESRLAAEQIEADALAILQREPEVSTTKTSKKMIGPEIKTLLLFYGVEKKDIKKKVPEMRDQLKKIMEDDKIPKQYKKWTQEEEEKLTSLGDDVPIDLEDTAWGRERTKFRKEKEEDLARYTKVFAKQGGNPQILINIINSATSSSSEEEEVSLYLQTDREEETQQSDSQATVFTPPSWFEVKKKGATDACDV